MPVILMDLLYLPAALLYLPVLLYQMLVQKKNRRGWLQRFGRVERRELNRPCVWIHAVSLGEINAARPFVEQIVRRLPSHDVAISATTDTGYASACRLYPSALVFRYPLDFSWVVRRVLRRIRPSAIVLMELEVWPNLITLTHRRGIPICIANGRVTEHRSMRGFRLPVLRGIARRMFSRIAWIAAQDATYAARFIELGAPKDRVFVTGSTKFDAAAISDRVEGDELVAGEMGIDRKRPLVVAGSTGPGEEEMLLAAYGAMVKESADLQLAIVPRRPERFEEVARLIESKGYRCRRRSHRDEGSGQTSGDSHRVVFLGDTMGELRKFYSLADVVFVGRTLVPLGGSDLMEIAGLGRPMCHGPYVENFADIAESLRSANAAVRIDNAAQLSSVLGGLLADPAAAKAMGLRAQDVVKRNLGASGKTVDLLCETLTESSRGAN